MPPPSAEELYRTVDSPEYPLRQREDRKRRDKEAMHLINTSMVARASPSTIRPMRGDETLTSLNVLDFLDLSFNDEPDGDCRITGVIGF